jgi:hypothetical protein
MKDLASGLFALVALRLSLEKGRASYLGATVAYLAALLSKPSAIAVPWMAAALAVAAGARGREVARRLVPWGLASLPVIWITKLAQPDAAMGNVTPFSRRWLVAADAWTASLSHVLFPFGLTVHSGRTPEWVLAQKATYFLWLLPAAIAIWLWRSRRAKEFRIPAALFTAFWLPVSGLVPFYYQRYSTVADRFLYLALLGPALVLAKAFRNRPGWACGLGLAALAMLSLRQLAYWSSPTALIGRMTALSSTAENHYSLAAWLAGEGRRKEAEGHYREAIRLNPHFAMAYNNLGLLLQDEGRSREAEQSLRRSLEEAPDLAQAHNNLGVLLASHGQVAAARREFETALALQPRYPEARENLARAVRLEPARTP